MMSSTRPFPGVRARTVLLLSGTLLSGYAEASLAQQRAPVARPTPAAANDRAVSLLRRQVDSLAQLYDDEGLTPSDRRRVVDALTSTMRRLSTLSVQVSPLAGGETMTVREFFAPGEAAMPRGWIGIVAEGAGLPARVERGEMIVRYMSYPRIVSVDPSSPAQKAGIVVDDTLLAYNGRDVRENDISLTRLLVPNTKVSVRVRHDGRVRDIPVTIAPVPSRVRLRRDDQARSVTSFSFVVPEAPMAPRAPNATGVAIFSPAPRPATPAMSGFAFTLETSGVFGARLQSITEGMGRAIGVMSGVLVLASPSGSPANESGVRDGDAIVRVNGELVRTVADVRAAVKAASDAGERSADLDVVRERRPTRIVLRW